MSNARIDKEGWFRCGKCGHKFGRLVGWNENNRRSQFPAIEIKCHSCKTINYMMIGGLTEAPQKPQD